MNDERPIEERAKEMGWRPKDEFRGNPESWTDAEDYVRRGEQILPIVKSDNQRLRTELNSARTQLAAVTAQITEAQESIAALKEFNNANNLTVVKGQRSDLAKRLVTARRDGDVEAEAELQEQLTDTTAAIREAEAAAASRKEGRSGPAGRETAPATGTSPETNPALKDPVYVQWLSENPWLGTDRRKTRLAQAISDELNADPSNTLRGRAFLDHVTEEVERTLGQSVNRQSKVEGGGSGGSGAGGNGGGRAKGYSELPQDAKDACKKQAQRLVGPNRAFKEEKAWQDHYAKIYWEKD